MPVACREQRFNTLTFALPESATGIWDESALKGPGTGAFTVITGARTIRDAAGSLWDISTHERLEAEQINWLTSNYANIVAANMIHLQVGVKENPVVATYWLSSTVAHYAPISEYDIMWGAGVTINIKTVDHNNIWYNISSHWSGQLGVFYLE